MVYPLPDTDEANVKWNYWKKDENHQLLKVESVGSYSDAYKYVADLVPQFLEHFATLRGSKQIPIKMYML